MLVSLPIMIIVIIFYSNQSAANKDVFHAAILIALVFFFLGSIIGILQRSKRERVWLIEKENQSFLSDNNLVDLGDGLLRDIKINQEYRILDVTRSRISLIAIARRNKRAYIDIDEQGKFVSYTGLITI